jgi:hypothetical protein
MLLSERISCSSIQLFFINIYCLDVGDSYDNIAFVLRKRNNLVADCFSITFARFTNNVLSTAQQVWLRKLGGAKPAVNENAGGIITAGQAKRLASKPERGGERSVFYSTSCSLGLSIPHYTYGNMVIHRFAQLKEEEKKKKLNKALPVEEVQPLASASVSDDGSDVKIDKVNIQLLKFPGH